MTVITRLPDRPLSVRDVAALDDDDRLSVVPYGGVPAGDELQLYALKLAVDGTAYALVFEDSRGKWLNLASTDATDPAAADTRLDAVLDEWVRGSYGGEFELVPVR
jgi:hypothetical protein